VSWISVDDRLPEVKGMSKRSDRLLIFTGWYLVGFYDGLDGEWKSLQDGFIRQVTHWMPLPAPPESRQGGG